MNIPARRSAPGLCPPPQVIESNLYVSGFFFLLNVMLWSRLKTWKARKHRLKVIHSILKPLTGFQWDWHGGSSGVCLWQSGDLRWARCPCSKSRTCLWHQEAFSSHFQWQQDVPAFFFWQLSAEKGLWNFIPSWWAKLSLTQVTVLLLKVLLEY